jgi:hypothetical protein
MKKAKTKLAIFIQVILIFLITGQRSRAEIDVNSIHQEKEKVNVGVHVNSKPENSVYSNDPTSVILYLENELNPKSEVE